jgi:anti-sigma factor ChrR (cupin superfamily)
MVLSEGLGIARHGTNNLVGDPSKPDPYTIHLKFSAGYKLAPHTHPASREVTILSGTWYTGYGEKFDPAALKALHREASTLSPQTSPTSSKCGSSRL